MANTVMPDIIRDDYTIDPRLLFTGLDIPAHDDLGEDGFEGRTVPASFIVNGPSRLMSELLDFLRRHPGVGKDMDRVSLQNFFSNENCEKFVSTAYRRRHYHSPVIHWATLDLEKIAPPLLLALVLTGATYSLWHETDSDDNRFPQRLQVLADKYIFSSLRTQVGMDITGNNNSQQTLEILQAAYLVNYLHISMNDVDMRRRVMTKRHPTLVMYVTELRLSCSQHTAGEMTQEFIFRESCVRLGTWTFLTDALLTLFFNNPPTMTLPGLRCDMPCSEEIWDAETLNVTEVPLSGFDLNRLIRGLLNEGEWSSDTAAMYESLSVQQLHAAIFAMQPMIFTWHTMLRPTAVAQALLCGLQQWRRLWDTAIDRVDVSQRQWLGVVRHAPEIAWLSLRTVQVMMEGKDRDSKYLQRIATYDLTDFHQFIRTHGTIRETNKNISRG